MNGEPTQRELYDAILNLAGTMSNLENRMTDLLSRFHELDEDFQSFRVELIARLL
jgi:hypothetical protein